MVLTSAIAPALFAGTAAAEDGDNVLVGDCDRGAIFGIIPWCEVRYEYIDTTGRTAEQVHYDYYVQGEAMEDNWRRQTIEATSHSNQSYGIGLAEAKYTIIKELNNGSSKAEAKRAAHDRVNEFYATQQKGLWSMQAANAKQAESIIHGINNSSGLGHGILVNYPLSCHDCRSEYSFETTNVTLWDGEQINVTHIETAYFDTSGGYVGGEQYHSFTYYDGQFAPASESVGRYKTLEINTPYNDTDTAIMLSGSDFKQSYEVLASNRQSTLNQIGPLADDIYANYDPGEISLAEVKSPAELVRTSITDYDETGDMAYPLLVAAERGYATNAQTNFDIQYTPAGTNTSQSLTGALATERGVFANDTIETGTYNTSDLNGNVWFYESTGTGVERSRLNGTFTVTEMRDVSENETVNSTKLQSSDFATRDADHMQEQVTETYDNRQNISKTVNNNYAVTLPDLGGDSGAVLVIVGLVVIIGGLLVVINLIGALKPL
ncbi:hypothetical protein AUR64_17370 [Haloprofundus marisrubri]|uniref:Envelope protein N-terminal domain-containing protein n=2 Tax=Haloprofundus marisrubri TaxID=1514971 RepID=A0A0W1R4V2_9EURY|nr:hypothetical protein AUR64_17370 [Haloprofundus marisrubri]